MALTVRGKLLATHVGLVALVIAGIVLALNWSLGADLSRRLDQRLEEQARGVATWVAESKNPTRIALRLANVVDARVTIVDAHGAVIGDSAHPDQPAAALPDARNQPEIAAARRGSVGRAIRRAADTGELTQYVAVPADYGTVVRLGVPLAEIEDTLATMRRRLQLTSVLAVGAALLLALLVARLVARPLKGMTAAAARIAQGDYAIQVPVGSRDELGQLAQALNTLAGQLRARIGDLTAERDRLSAILAGMVEGVLVVSPPGAGTGTGTGTGAIVVIANPSAARIMGAGAEVLVGKPVVDVPLAGVRALLDEAVRTAAPVESELEAGGGRQLTVNARPLASAAGGGVVAVLHDVTPLRRLETMRRDFIANASHELRTPVAAIQGYAETLLDSPADAATNREFLEIIHRHGRRIGRLVEDLLRLSELEARGPDQALRAPVTVAPIAALVAQTVRRRAEAMGATVMLAVPDTLVARGDATGLEQVLENLVDNAIKYGRRGGQVTIAGELAPGRVRLIVRDDGPGIAAEHLPRLFERFYRVDPSRPQRSGDQGGTGLGLAIVKHLIEAMGGAVTVASELERGTTFTLELPAEPPAAPNAA